MTEKTVEKHEMNIRNASVWNIYRSEIYGFHSTNNHLT